MTAQNCHILQKLEEAVSAVQVLSQRGLSVTHVEIDGPYPRINLLRAPAPNSLTVCWKAIRPKKHGSGREIEMAARVDGCEVRWMEQE